MIPVSSMLSTHPSSLSNNHMVVLESYMYVVLLCDQTGFDFATKYIFSRLTKGRSFDAILPTKATLLQQERRQQIMY